MKQKKYAFHFAKGVDQDDEDLVDSVNEVLVMMFGDQVSIDWRDDHEVWITTDVQHESQHIEDRTWTIE